MRFKVFTAAAFVFLCTSASQANYAPVTMSAVGIAPTKISAVRPSGYKIDPSEISETERRRVALLGMILLKAKGLPVVQ